ncbi:MAG: aminotransferase class V-fold PLP-dependent enzyme, partial [Rhodospirillaceae bacterium]|nr:aminotransferase class V-fold PLP-dependent enzyme [Rhodospirillaceae bacterium]
AEVVKIAHAAGVPVIVDAAAQLPPQANLRRFIELGADLVAFSGGKALNGPQGTGILAGRRDLVMAAALQHLDLDIAWEQWSPPATLIDKDRLKGVPQHGIGRPCKVGKEQIIGLLTALELFVAEGDAARHQRWRTMMEVLANSLQGVPGEVALHGVGGAEEVPTVTLTLRPNGRLSALDLVIALQNGLPPIQADPLQCDRGIVAFNPMCLQPGEAETVAASVRGLLLA